MKKIFLIGLFFALAFNYSLINAQGVAVTDDASYEPDASAILDVKSDSKGLLPPRMSTLQRDAINTPAEGLVIYNSDSKNLELFNGTAWVTATGEPTDFICGTSQIEDVDGNKYNTVLIGIQCWMAENLNTGTRIEGVTGMTDNSIIEKYCYDDNINNCNTYGGLYQWDEIMQYITTAGVQGICPRGWHIPTDAEWCILEQEVDPTITGISTGWRGFDGGTKMKQGGSSGFEGMIAGLRNTGGGFSNVGAGGYFWSSVENSSSAWNRYLYKSNATVSRNSDNKLRGLSVRCLKD